MSAISSQISDWPCSPLLSEEHQLSSPALAKCSVCVSWGWKNYACAATIHCQHLNNCGHRVLHLENLAPRA
jgi:hypothetical protein